MFRKGGQYFDISLNENGSASMAGDCGVHQNRAAADSETGHRTRRDEDGERQLAGILRRKAWAVHRETGSEIPDMVDCWLLGGKNDAGGSFPSGYDLS